MAAILPYLPTIIAALGAAVPFMTKKGRKGMFGEEGHLEEYQPFNQQQEDLIGQFGSTASSNLPGMNAFLNKFIGGDEASFNEFAAPYLRHFETQIAPSILERFGGGGSSGMSESAASSGLYNALFEAGSGLEQGLASERQTQGLKASALMQNLAQLGLTPVKGFQNISAQKGAIGEYLPTIMKLLASFNDQKPAS